LTVIIDLEYYQITDSDKKIEKFEVGEIYVNRIKRWFEDHT